MKTNIVVISGGLTRDPESKFTTTGKQVCNFSLGTDTGYGEKKESSYFDCVAWEKTAENIVKYLRKGSQVVVSGSLRQRRWEKDGERHAVVEIVARNVEFGAKPKDAPAEERDDVPPDGAA